MKAQRAWGDSIVDIGRIETEGGDFKARAGQFVDSLYALSITDVLFKPTMAEEKPFRTTREGVLSYFIGNAPTSFPEDVKHGGFARHHWKAVRFEVAGNWLGPGAALSMGHYIFTDMSGADHVAEFSFGYVRDSDGHLRVALHHSSFPYCGEEFVTASPCKLSWGTELASAARSMPPIVQQLHPEFAGIASSAVFSAEKSDQKVPIAEKFWGNRIVALGQAPSAEVHSMAVEFVRHSYAYGAQQFVPWTGPGTLFKPTRARIAPFRTTLEGAVSYFVGSDATFSEDKGFALAPWTKVRFEAAGTTALSPWLTVTMGHYIFTATDGEEHRAEYSMAFVSAGSGISMPLLALHHSSFPFCSTCGSTLMTSGNAATSDALLASLGPSAVIAGLVLTFLVVSSRTRSKEQLSTGSVALLQDSAEI
jgi:hypothetical protein